MLSHPSLNRLPDQSIIESGQGEKGEYITAFKDSLGHYLMVYLPVGKTVTIKTSGLKTKTIKALWFNPANGKTTGLRKLKRKDAMTFTPPTTGFGNDWVLVLDAVIRR
jgi:hypothetical protein